MAGLVLDDMIDDEEKLNNGVWVDFPEAEGVAVKIASSNSDAYRTGMAKAADKLPKNRKAWTEKMLLNVQLPLIAKHIVIDWKGMNTRDKSGKVKPIKCTEAAALEYLKTSRKLRDFVVGHMTDEDNFLRDFREDAAKN